MPPQTFAGAVGDGGRFAVAGGANRYRAVRRSEVQDILALDIARRRNDRG